MVGKNEWRHADDLKGATTPTVRFHLASDGRADDVHHSGQLVELAPESGQDRYHVDPADARLHEADTQVGQEVPLVNRPDAAPIPGAGLVYHSEPLKRATEYSGSAMLQMTVSMDAPDTDFWVGLFEVRPDGQSIFLSNTVLRARDQGGLKQANEKYVYRLDDFWFFAAQLNVGSRLRLVISPPIGSTWQRNRQSGKTVNEETAADNHPATITLHHGRETFIELGHARTHPK